jgi:hypothetical protein
MKKTTKLCILLVTLFTLMIIGCQENESTRAVSDMQNKDQAITAKTFERLRAAVPPPELTDSVERSNLVRRLERFNVPSKISYIYLVSYGKVMSYYTIKGKVSSVNSMLTCTEQIVYSRRSGIEGGISFDVVPSPDLDGSYGSNGDGIFFFTTEGVYVEWNGEYMLCDEPLKLSTPPALMYVRDK